MEQQSAERAPAEPAVAFVASKSPSHARARSANPQPPPAAGSETLDPSHPPQPHSVRSASAEAHGARLSSFSFDFLDEEQVERTCTGTSTVPFIIPVPNPTSAVRAMSSAAMPASTVPPPLQPSVPPMPAFSWPASTSLNPNYFNMAASSFTIPTGAFDQQNALRPLQVPSCLSMLSGPISTTCATSVFPLHLLPQAYYSYPTSSLSSSQVGQPYYLPPTATLPLPSTTEAAAARLVIADPTPPPCPVLPAAAALANAHYYCRYCSCGSTCPSDWVAHWNSGAHQFNVQCARERLWNYRQPNWLLEPDEYQLCGSYMRESTPERKMCGVHSGPLSRSVDLDQCIKKVPLVYCIRMCVNIYIHLWTL